MAGERNVEQMLCSLYISSRNETKPDTKEGSSVPINPALLEKAVQELHPAGKWTITKTSCGLIVSFSVASDADKLLERNLAEALGGPVQVARFSADTTFRQAVLLVNVPFIIPIEDILVALKAQGFTPGRVSKARQHIRVEVLDSYQYESILQSGLNFYGATKFRAVPERTWRGPAGSNANNEASEGPGPQESTLQCYHCQGFWHVAAHCRQMARCVRCGGGHDVKYCSRARNDPICCHCAGPHHAAYWNCPVRKQILNATPVTLTLATEKGMQTKQMWTGGN